MRRIGSAMLLLGVLTGQAVAADTRHDGTWTGTYHPVQALGAKCNTNTTKHSMVVKDGVATMRTTSARNGAKRVYTGTVNGDTLDMVSEDELIYSGTFSGNHYRATTGRGLCTNGIDLDRVP